MATECPMLDGEQMRKIYHYAPFRPSEIFCDLNECHYNCTDEIAKVNCKDCLKLMSKCSSNKCDNPPTLMGKYCDAHGGVIAGV